MWRSMAALAAGALFIVLAGLGLDRLAAATEPSDIEYPPGSVQDTILDYFAWWDDRNLKRTYAFFSDDVQAATSPAQYRRAVDELWYGFRRPQDPTAVGIEGVEGSGDRAIVRVSVEHLEPASDANSFEKTFAIPMIRDAEGWKIDRFLIGYEAGPYPFEVKVRPN